MRDAVRRTDTIKWLGQTARGHSSAQHDRRAPEQVGQAPPGKYIRGRNHFVEAGSIACASPGLQLQGRSGGLRGSRAFRQSKGKPHRWMDKKSARYVRMALRLSAIQSCRNIYPARSSLTDVPG